MEHSPITLETLRNIVLATRGLPALTFARVPVNEIWTAKRVLDAGVSGVMFPFTSTPELAAQAAAACRYPVSYTHLILLGNGDGTFQAAVSYGAGMTLFSVAVGDFNGDGKLDLAVANEGSNNVSILLGLSLIHI